VTEVKTDCRSFDGITVGLIDSIITAARVLVDRPQCADSVQEALKDLRSDTDVRYLLLQENTDQKKSESAFYLNQFYKRMCAALDLEDDPVVTSWHEIIGRAEIRLLRAKEKPQYPIIHRHDTIQGMVIQYDENVFIWHTLPTKTRKAEQRVASSLKKAWAYRASHLRVVKEVV